MTKAECWMFTRGAIFCQSLQLLPKLNAFMKILSEYFFCNENLYGWCYWIFFLYMAPYMVSTGCENIWHIWLASSWMLYDGFGNAWNSSVAREMPRIVSSYQFTCACKASKGSGVCTYTLTKGRQRRRGRAVRGSNHDNHRCTAGQEKNQMERPVLHHLANESDGAITDRSVEQPCPSWSGNTQVVLPVWGKRGVSRWPRREIV